MKKFLHTVLSGIAVAIILAVSPLNHASAMQPENAEGMNHSGTSSMSQHCSMLCATADANKEDKLNDEAPDDDDEPSPLYFQQFDSVHSGYYVEKSVTSRTVDLPSKVPKYRLCCVIRR